MTTLRLLVFTLVICVVGGSQRVVAQKPAQPDSDTAAINTLYTDWSKATATRGADGYVSFWVADGAAVLPPDAPAVEGKEAIRQWIQKVLDEYTVKVTSLSPVLCAWQTAGRLDASQCQVNGCQKKAANPSNLITNISMSCKSKLTARGNSFIGCGAITSNKSVTQRFSAKLYKLGINPCVDIPARVSRAFAKRRFIRLN
jgi:hypothetical protein